MEVSGVADSIHMSYGYLQLSNYAYETLHCYTADEGAARYCSCSINYSPVKTCQNIAGALS